MMAKKTTNDNADICNLFLDDDSCKEKNNPLDDDGGGDNAENTDKKDGDTVKKTKVSFFITSEGSVQTTWNKRTRMWKIYAVQEEISREET